MGNAQWKVAGILYICMCLDKVTGIFQWLCCFRNHDKEYLYRAMSFRNPWASAATPPLQRRREGKVFVWISPSFQRKHISAVNNLQGWLPARVTDQMCRLFVIELFSLRKQPWLLFLDYLLVSLAPFLPFLKTSAHIYGVLMCHPAISFLPSFVSFKGFHQLLILGHRKVEFGWVRWWLMESEAFIGLITLPLENSYINIFYREYFKVVQNTMSSFPPKSKQDFTGEATLPPSGVNTMAIYRHYISFRSSAREHHFQTFSSFSTAEGF